MGYPGLSIYSLARFNSMLMAAALAVLFSAIRKKTNTVTSFLATLFLGVSYSAWHYAVDGRAIGASVFPAALIIHALVKIDEREDVLPGDAVSLSVYSSLYFFIHGISIFHCIGIIWFLLMCFPSVKAARSRLFLYGTVFLFIISLTYGAVYYYIVRPYSNIPFHQWVVGYAAQAGFGKIDESNFWVVNITQAFSGLWWGLSNAISASRTFLTKFISSSITLLFLALIIKPLIRKDKPEMRKNKLVYSLYIWGGVITLFLTFWSPGQEGYRLLVLWPWLTALVISSYPSRFLNWFLGTGAALIFYLNFSFVIYPSAFIQNNKGYQLLKELRGNLASHDLFLSLHQGDVIPGIEVLRPYFFPEIKGGTIEGRLFAFNEKSLEPLLSRLKINSQEGHQIYMSESVFNPELGRKLESKFELPDGEYSRFIKYFRPIENFQLSTGDHIYRVEVLK